MSYLFIVNYTASILVFANVLCNYTFQNNIWYDHSNSSVNSIAAGCFQVLIPINYRLKLHRKVGKGLCSPFQLLTGV